MELFNFEEMRYFILSQPGSIVIKRLRVALFDRYRYEEDYESIYKLITDLKEVNK